MSPAAAAPSATSSPPDAWRVEVFKKPDFPRFRAATAVQDCATQNRNGRMAFWMALLAGLGSLGPKSNHRD